MYRSHTPQQALQVASRALATIEGLGMAPHPDNFVLWYNYISGDCPGLQHALDNLVDSNSFTEEHGARLRAEFLDTGMDVSDIEQFAAKLQTDVAQALSLIDEAGKGTARYGASLAKAGNKVVNGAPPADLVKVIGRLMADTLSALEHSKTVVRKLAETAVEVQQLRDDLETTRREASVDALTGVLNRRHFDIILREAVAEANSNGTAVSVMFADVDHFKKFNDAYGHAVGDQVLKLVGKILKENVRGKDTPARYGGEEFIVLLPHTPLNGAAVVAESIRKYLSDHSLINKKNNQSVGKITISIGVAEYIKDEPVEQFVSRADAALYRAKQTGRNRVVADTGQPVESEEPNVAAAQ